MSVRIMGGASRIAEAIRAFPPAYQADFFAVRTIARRHLAAAAPDQAVAWQLAGSLEEALKNWGAGRRKAPAIRSREELAAAFCDSALHGGLTKLHKLPIHRLSVVGGERRIDGRAATTAVEDLDDLLLKMLNTLAGRLFIGNTNATYPMKALLLIAGLMPAFDSQVRKGLGRGGFDGMAATRFLLPTCAQEANGRKVTRLPFVLGQCWWEYEAVLREGVHSSGVPALADEPGRLFDVLLFMQGDEGRPPVITWVAEEEPWYRLG